MFKFGSRPSGPIWWLFLINLTQQIVAFSFYPTSTLPRTTDPNDLVSRHQSRKSFLKNFISTHLLISSASSVTHPKPAFASNLPQNTGADFSKSNTVEALIPIVKMDRSLRTAKSLLHGNSDEVGMKALAENIISVLKSSIPLENEIAFKKIFDEYSDPVSYKQKFMDQNAFLVYYTKGFDGPNRPSMESGDVPKQTLQYGSRNDAWVAVNDLVEELMFAKKSGDGSSVEDLLIPLDRAIVAFAQYLSLAPKPDVEKANQSLI